MKILLVCATGASTSLVVEKMKESLTNEEREFIIKAEAIENFENVYADYDVALLGPQVRYKLKKFSEIAKEDKIPVDVINPIDYSMGNGKNIIDHAKKLVQDFK